MTFNECNECKHETIVGVLITRKQIKYLKRGTPGNRIVCLQRANNKAKTSLYFFSIEDVDMNILTIDGMYFDEDKEIWTNKTFPFPDVLYNRGGVRKSQRSKFLSFKDELKKKGVKHLNYIQGFNKWKVYECLNQIEDLQCYLPLTWKFTSIDDLISKIKSHDKLYLKACRGRKGYQVMRVAKLSDGIYEYRYFTKEDRLRLRKVNMRGLVKAINEFFCSSEFIIQKAIDLLTIDDKIVDMRAEVQRNGLGELEFTSICVRLSQKNAPITTHANSYRLEEFFDKYMGYSQEEIKALRKRVEDFLFNVYTATECFYGPIGEIGIDFALDKANRIWFIECNSQPAKVSLMKAYDEETIEKAYLNPLEYAKYITAEKGGDKNDRDNKWFI
ncbi:UNVERIFIED_CONTAM: YheC/D-like protein [Acetivibrio alkalicellulosi]